MTHRMISFCHKATPAHAAAPLAVAVALMVVSCSEDFIERTPLDSYTVSNFYENADQITQAVNALYPVIRGDYTGELWQLGEFRSDNTTYQLNAQDRGAIRTEEIDYFLSNSAMAPANSLWNSSYQAISRANLLLDRVDEADFAGQEDLRTLRTAEARFVRAFMYWQLVRNFGDAVLILEPIFEEAALLQFDRVPVDQIYSQAILPDLEFAIANLPATYPRTETGRATRGAAQMLLAQAYFTRKDYASAKPILDSLAANQQYGLFPDYRGLFAPENDNNREIIFAAQFSVAAGQGSSWMLNWVPLGTGNTLSGGGTAPAVGPRAGFNIPTRDLVRAYERGDARFGASVGIFVNRGDTVYYNRKFLFPPLPSDVDFPIFRYAEVLLMQAEAALIVDGDAGLNTALTNINLIRDRAKLPLAFPGNPDEDLDIRDATSGLEFVRRERRIELALENKRWYDLVRYGTYEEVMQAHGVEQKRLQPQLRDLPEAYTRIPALFPIPNLQVVQYGYTQNPGY